MTYLAFAMDDQPKPGQVLAYATIPFVLAFPPLVGWWIGRWLDSLLGTAPVFMYAVLVLGIAAGVREFVRIIRKYKD